MFELEVGTRELPAATLPGAVVTAFQDSGRRVLAFSLTPWEEHCTECAMPGCYTTCDLYEARTDGKCRRFVRGIEIIPIADHPQGYVAKVQFKRWGQLMAATNSRPLPLAGAMKAERRVRTVESVVASLPGASISIAGRRGIASRLTRRWKEKFRQQDSPEPALAAESLLLEVFHPGTTPLPLSVSVASLPIPDQPRRPPFQKLIQLVPGFQSIEIPVSEFAGWVNLDHDFNVTLNPNILRAEDEGLTLYFGLLSLVAWRHRDAAPVGATVGKPKVDKTIKVAVWDLDNTLWAGTLIEDGPAGIRLRNEAVTVVRELDRRGIVNSVLSKNHEEDARAALRHFGVDEYFVFPKIGWGEKGAYMKGLIRDFNVDASTFAFIDDQEFERAQVVATNPGVRAYDSADLSSLLDRPEFNPAQSAESASRRQFYRAEEHRVKEAESFGGEYLAFLRTCGMRAEISHPETGSFDRVQELVQRTNQLNYSGTHYNRDEITSLLNDPAHEALVVSCVDNFGAYGTVGFALIDRDTFRLRDAMFSCRIQFKRVEHAMLGFLLHRYRDRGAPYFEARFCETKKNSPAAAVFGDMGFEEVSRDGATRIYRFDLGRPIPDEGIVAITYEGTAWRPSDPS